MVALEAFVFLNSGIFQRLSVVVSTTGHCRSCLQAFISYCSCCGQGRTCNGCVCFSRTDGIRRESFRTAIFGSKRSLEGVIVSGLEALLFQDSVFLHRGAVSVVRSWPCSVTSGRLSCSFLGPLPAGRWFGHHLVVLAFS